jgi:hypothetical protein
MLACLSHHTARSSSSLIHVSRALSNRQRRSALFLGMNETSIQPPKLALPVPTDANLLPCPRSLASAVACSSVNVRPGYWVRGSHTQLPLLGPS